MNTQAQGPQSRPVSVPHLVLGIVFAGIAAIWFLGEATNADLPRTAVGFPVVLIGAGAIGLVAVVVNSRRARTPLETAAFEAPTSHPDTVVIEEQS